MKIKWSPFDTKSAPAETPVFIRTAGGDPVAAIINGHGQVLAADTRHLLDVVPAEIGLPAADKPGAPETPA